MMLFIVIIVLLLPLVLLAGAIVLNRVPLTDSPGFAVRLKTYLTQNVAVLRPDSPYPELWPKVYPIKPGLLCARILPALESLGWEWREAEGDCHYHALVRTPLLGFRDDVLVGVEPVGDSSSRLTVRSSSRLGRGDLGANIRHVLDLVAAVEEQ